MALLSPFDTGKLPEGTQFVFIHIPKCAGTSFGGFLKDCFKGTYIDGRSLLSDRTFKYSLSDVRQILQTFQVFKCFADHKFSLSLPDDMPIMPMAIIREPVARFLSHYFYCREVATDGIVFDLDAQQLTLSEYIDKTLYDEPKQDLWNGQCWHLMGASSYEEKEQGLARLLDRDFFCVPVDHLSTAALFLHWKFPDTFKSRTVLKENITSRGTRPPVEDELIDRIQKRMDLDVKLYRHSLNMYEKYIHGSLPVASVNAPVRRRLQIFRSDICSLMRPLF